MRKAAEDSQKEAASASLVDALLKAHAGDNSQLMAQLQGAQAAAAGSAGSSQVRHICTPQQGIHTSSHQAGEAHQMLGDVDYALCSMLLT